jgi:hypothetical protein
MVEEIPFLAAQRPWERVDLVICGTPLIAFDPATELVVASPPAAVPIVRASRAAGSRVRGFA